MKDVIDIIDVSRAIDGMIVIKVSIQDIIQSSKFMSHNVV